MTMLTSEFELDDGVEFQTYLYKEDARIFKFTIPHDISDNTSVTIKASSYRGNSHDFTLSISSKFKPDEPSTGLMSRKGISAWKNG
jgi:hypothetical protein